MQKICKNFFLIALIYSITLLNLPIFKAFDQVTTPTVLENTDMKSDEIINIPDTNLRTYLNSLLKQATDAPITQTQMESIKYISTNNISDLTGLEYATNALNIYISSLLADDISNIAHLTNLESLTLSGTELTELPDMNGLTSLTNLTINTPITTDEFSKFNKLPLLRYLNLDGNTQITDIILLAELPKLDTLFIQFCGVTDFTIIDKFPALKQLSAFGQNTGRYNPTVTLRASEMEYNPEQETLFLPFSMMPHRLKNFDGTLSPLTLSSSASQTYLAFDGVQVEADRLSISSEGILIQNLPATDFENIQDFTYNAYYSWRAGDYPKPDWLTSYSISSGTYLQRFSINHAPITYTVSFETNGGSAVDPIVDVLPDSLITSPSNPTKNGFVFDGWYQDTQLTIPWNFATDTVNSDITLFAKWNTITPPQTTYTVTFETNGGSVVNPIVDVLPDSLITSPTNPTKDGFVFDGWYKDAQLTIPWDFTVDTVNSNITLFAKWNAITPPQTTYTVFFETSGGSVVNPIVDVLPYSLITSPTNPTKDGFVFDGWYLDAQLTTPWNFATDTVNSDIKLFAKWNAIVPPLVTYTVSFESNGGSVVNPITDVLLDSLITSPSNPTKDGFVFDGWYQEAQLTTPWNFATDTVNSDITLFAKWTPNGSENPNLPITGTFTLEQITNATLLLMISTTILLGRKRFSNKKGL